MNWSILRIHFRSHFTSNRTINTQNNTWHYSEKNNIVIRTHVIRVPWTFKLDYFLYINILHCHWFDNQNKETQMLYMSYVQDCHLKQQMFLSLFFFLIKSKWIIVCVSLATSKETLLCCYQSAQAMTKFVW